MIARRLSCRHFPAACLRRLLSAALSQKKATGLSCIKMPCKSWPGKLRFDSQAHLVRAGDHHEHCCDVLPLPRAVSYQPGECGADCTAAAVRPDLSSLPSWTGVAGVCPGVWDDKPSRSSPSGRLQAAAWLVTSCLASLPVIYRPTER